MRKRPVQYTIRNVSERTDRLLREAALEYGTSLNDAALSALTRGLGVEPGCATYRDLDALIGTWVQDDDFDKALAEMDRIDADMWS